MSAQKAEDGNAIAAEEITKWRLTVPYVYVLTNPAMPGLVKIGKTEDDANTRIAQLFTTGLPFPFNLEFACRVTAYSEVERALHVAFAPYRVNPRREFFKIEAAQAIAILKLLHTEDATEEVAEEVAAEVNAGSSETQKDVEVGTRAGEQYRQRRPNMNFREMNIPFGSILTSTATEQEVTVIGDKKVKLGDEEMFLTPATKRVLNLDYSVAPGPYWTYQGRLLQDIYDETYPAGE